jgi:hypothetical protein
MGQGWGGAWSGETDRDRRGWYEHRCGARAGRGGCRLGQDAHHRRRHRRRTRFALSSGRTARRRAGKGRRGDDRHDAFHECRGGAPCSGSGGGDPGGTAERPVASPVRRLASGPRSAGQGASLHDTWRPRIRRSPARSLRRSRGAVGRRRDSRRGDPMRRRERRSLRIAKRLSPRSCTPRCPRCP